MKEFKELSDLSSRWGASLHLALSQAQPGFSKLFFRASPQLKKTSLQQWQTNFSLRAYKHAWKELSIKSGKYKSNAKFPIFATQAFQTHFYSKIVQLGQHTNNFITLCLHFHQMQASPIMILLDYIYPLHANAPWAR